MTARRSLSGVVWVNIIVSTATTQSIKAKESVEERKEGIYIIGKKDNSLHEELVLR